jgi:hypothetical protein
MKRVKRLLATTFTTAFMAFGIAAPAGAQPVITGGLVNITIVDVVNQNDVNVQVPIGVAANVCGIQANVLASGNLQGPVDCTAHNPAELPVVLRETTAPNGGRAAGPPAFFLSRVLPCPAPY